MQIWISRIDPKTHRFRALRPPHPPVDLVLETRSMLLHDFAHYALEATLETDQGFYGLVAAGADVPTLREHQLPPDQWEELMALEGMVAMLQSSFKRGERRSGDASWELLRAVNGAWSKARQGEALFLPWPQGEGGPQIVPDPGAEAFLTSDPNTGGVR